VAKRIFYYNRVKKVLSPASFSATLLMLCIQFGYQPKNPDVVRLPGFFIPIFHSAILIDAKRKKRRVDGI